MDLALHKLSVSHYVYVCACASVQLRRGQRLAHRRHHLMSPGSTVLWCACVCVCVGDWGIGPVWYNGDKDNRRETWSSRGACVCVHMCVFMTSTFHLAFHHGYCDVTYTFLK